MLPAQAGVVQHPGQHGRGPARAPRAGGGGPRPHHDMVEMLFGAPRAGGGGPQSSPSVPPSTTCSPRRRGWSEADRHPCLLVQGAPRAGGGGPIFVNSQSDLFQVLPAQAGVVRASWWRSTGAAGCSPRRRGWSDGETSLPGLGFVLPAQAGVVRWRSCGASGSCRSSPLEGSQRDLLLPFCEFDQVSLITPGGIATSRHQPQRRAADPSLITPGGIATWRARRPWRRCWGRSSPLEGSQPGLGSALAGPPGVAHHPWRDRNWHRPHRCTTCPWSLITPGGIATRGAAGTGRLPNQSLITPGGIATGTGAGWRSTRRSLITPGGTVTVAP